MFYIFYDLYIRLQSCATMYKSNIYSCVYHCCLFSFSIISVVTNYGLQRDFIHTNAIYQTSLPASQGVSTQFKTIDAIDTFVRT